MCRQSSRRVISLPIGLDANAVDFAGSTILICVGICFDFCKAWIFAFCDKFADFVCAHIDDWGKFDGCSFGVFYNSRLGENGLDFIAGGKHSAPTIKDDTTLRLLGQPLLLLLCAGANIMAAPEKLQIKAPC